MSEPAVQQPQNDFSELPVGEILRRTRVHYARSIEEVEAALRIQAKQIHAIEVGDTDALPARVYALGFVRSYAEYLGLDGDKIVNLFKAQTGTTTPKPDIKKKVPTAQSNNPPVGIVVGLLVLICALMIGFLSLNASEEKAINEPEVVPEVPKELRKAALEEKQTPEPAPEPEPEPEPTPQPVVEKQEGIVLKLVQNSWVEIRDKNNRKLISRVLKEGDQYFVPERLGLTISIGNAGGVEIQVDGEPLQDLGESGQVLRNIPLNAKALKERFPVTAGQTSDTQAQKPVETSRETE